MQLNNKQLSDTATQISGLTLSLTSAKTQLSNINSQEETARSARADEQHQVEVRKSGSEKVLEALQKIHDKLAAVVLKDGAFLQMEDRKVLAQSLKTELGERNPLAMMVELTAK